MFFHNLKYSMKILLKKKALIFWTIIWPLVLGTMFYLAFSNISSKEELSIINLGVVNNDLYQNDGALKDTLETMSNKNDEAYLFDITYGTIENLNQLLEDKNISGYILVGDTTKVVIKENGINQTIIKSVVDQIHEYKTLVANIIKNNMENNPNIDVNMIYTSVMDDLKKDNVYLDNNSKDNMDYIVIEFYTLIAMTALFGALITSSVICDYLANVNKKGARITLAPAGRLKLLLSGLLTSYIVQAFAMTILLAYTIFILKVDYGKFDLVILLSFVGSIAGNALGLLTGSMTFKSDSTRTGIVMAVTMIGCFFSGMMGISMKYVIDKGMPILNYINPANMITDGFYALYYYDSLNRFWFNIGSLLVFSTILLIISYFLMRRKKYDSI